VALGERGANTADENLAAATGRARRLTGYRSACCLRYLLALVSTFMLGLGFVWALIDRERCFLHDRLAGTCIIMQNDGVD
jgi:hypothetical protein